MNNRIVPLIVIVLLLIIAGGAYAYLNGKDVGAPDKVELAVGERGDALGTTIGVLELVEDSRCPVDVQCIQAGTVRVRIAVNAMSRDFTLTLGEPQSIAGVKITLMAVSPGVKNSNVTVSPADYRFTFAVAAGVTLKEYSNPTYGIAFSYPETYELTEREVGNGERKHYSIVLIERANLPLPENGEGPPAITFDIFQNNIDKLTLQQWLVDTNQSNFKLGDGTYTVSSQDGTETYSYSWSGLYEGDSTALSHKDNIVMISATHLTPQDQIRADYLNLLTSLDLI